MTSMLPVPDPLMPETVRYAHMREIAPSNFLFGMLIAWLLTQRRAATPEAELRLHET